MKAADISQKHVLAFCRTVSKSQPVVVPVRPKFGKELNDCTNIVKEHVLMHGGVQHLGWAIWEWPTVMIEAEFHTIWEAPDGFLVDLTPKPCGIDTILFLPDNKIEYRGRQINNIRKPLTMDKDVKRLIALHNQFFVELNKGDLADYHGSVVMTERIRKLQQEMQQFHMRIARKHGWS